MLFCSPNYNLFYGEHWFVSQSAPVGPALTPSLESGQSYLGGRQFLCGLFEYARRNIHKSPSLCHFCESTAGCFWLFLKRHSLLNSDSFTLCINNVCYVFVASCKVAGWCRFMRLMIRCSYIFCHGYRTLLPVSTCIRLQFTGLWHLVPSLNKTHFAAAPVHSGPLLCSCDVTPVCSSKLGVCGPSSTAGNTIVSDMPADFH